MTCQCEIAYWLRPDRHEKRMVVFEIPYVCLLFVCVVVCCVVLLVCLFACLSVSLCVLDDSSICFCLCSFVRGGRGLANTCRFVVEMDPGMMSKIVG